MIVTIMIIERGTGTGAGARTSVVNIIVLYAIQYNYNTIQYNAIQYDYNIIQYNTIQYNTMI